MAGETLTLFANFMKTVYILSVRSVINSASWLYFRMDRDTESIVGSSAVFPVQTGFLPVYARSEDGTIGSAGSIPTIQCSVPMIQHYAPIEFSGLLRAASKNDEGAYVRVLDASMKTAVMSLKRQLNMEVALDNTGNLATTSNTDGAATWTSGSPLTLNVSSSQHMWPGMVLDILDVDDGSTSKTTGMRIKSVVSDTSVTCFGTTSATLQNGDIIYVYGNKGNQFYGLRNIFAQSGSYLGITLTDNVEFRAQYDGGSSTNRDLTTLLMQKMIDNAEQKAMGNITEIVCRPAVRRAYYDLLVGDRRYNADKTMKLPGGFSGLEYLGGSNPIPVIAERDLLPNKMYFLDGSTFTLFRMQDYDWYKGSDERILFPLITASTPQDRFRAVLYGYENLATSAPAKSALLDYITEK